MTYKRYTQTFRLNKELVDQLAKLTPEQLNHRIIEFVYFKKENQRVVESINVK